MHYVSRVEVMLMKMTSNSNNVFEIPVWNKCALTLTEAASYSGIGINKLRELSNEDNCEFVLWNGSKRLIKRKELDKFISEAYSI